MSNRKDWGLSQKILFVIAMVILYRIGVSIPIPFVNSEAFSEQLGKPALDTLLYATTMVGGSLSQLGIMSLGVLPFITASIIFQLLKVISPKINEMHKSDLERKKITQWTRYLAVVLSITQSVGFVIGAPALMGFSVFTTTSYWAIGIGIFAMTVGATLAMRIGEEITLRGIGNGTSLLIFTSILSTIPAMIAQTYRLEGTQTALIFVGFLILIFGFIMFVEKSEYRIPITYTKSGHNVSRSTQASMLPVKVAIAGVLPAIFAGTLTMLPTMIAQFYSKEWLLNIADKMTFGSPWFIAVTIVLTILFTFFSIKMVFDIDRISTELRSQGGFIDGKRPGEETENYLKKIGNQMGVLDAIYLSLITAGTLIVMPLLGITNNSFAATSIIILGTVVVTFLSAVDSERFKGKHESMLY